MADLWLISISYVVSRVSSNPLLDLLFFFSLFLFFLLLWVIPLCQGFLCFFARIEMWIVSLSSTLDRALLVGDWRFVDLPDTLCTSNPDRMQRSWQAVYDSVSASIQMCSDVYNVPGI